MRVLYAVTAAQYGGAPRHVAELMRYFVSRGVEVGVVCAPEHTFIREAALAGVRVYSNPNFVLEMNPRRDVSALMPVVRAIKDFRPDIVHAHSTKAGLAARMACAMLRVRPVLFTAHGWAFSEGRSQWKRQAFAVLERMAARVTDRIICVSEHDRELALDFAVAREDQLTVVHNGVSFDSYINADGHRIRNEVSPSGEPIITMVGRLAVQKNPLLLLEACRQFGRCRVLIVGDGPLRLAMEGFVQQHQLQDKVILTGERQDIPQLLAASDVFMLTSKWEGLPYTIIEAMASGLPVVSTSVGGVPELVEDKVTGFMVDDGDVAGLVQATNALLRDKPLRFRMGTAGRERVQRLFGVSDMLEKTAAVYESVCGKPFDRSKGSKEYEAVRTT